MRILGPRGLVLEDNQKFVFRDKDNRAGTRASAPGEPARMQAAWKRTITVDPVTLFRFSACCFNPHRIHYDHPYTTAVENYPGLVVQGPLTAVLLLELMREHVEERALKMSGFTMRARSALFADRPFTLLGEPAADGASCRLWAADDAGNLSMEILAGFR
jgi:3-methylfumaryl-CoA hydratase